MMVLITYDVNVTTQEGRTRLRKVAKKCLNYGQRVQNSVFECIVTPDLFVKLKNDLTKLINHKTDSIRFYNLGKNWHNRVEHIGIKTDFDVTAPLIF